MNFTAKRCNTDNCTNWQKARGLCAGGANQSHIAKRFSVTHSAINNIVLIRSWKHVQGDSNA